MNERLRQLVERTRRESNVPPIPTDPVALATVARIIDDKNERRPAAVPSRKAA